MPLSVVGHYGTNSLIPRFGVGLFKCPTNPPDPFKTRRAGRARGAFAWLGASRTLSAVSGSRSYEEAKRTFSDFVAKTFPMDSDESDAITQIARGVHVPKRFPRPAPHGLI